MTPLANSLAESVARYVAATALIREWALRSPSLREWRCDTDSSISPQIQLIQFSGPKSGDWPALARQACEELRATYSFRDARTIEARLDGWKLLFVAPFSPTEDAK